MMNLHSIFCQSLLIVVDYLCCLSPTSSFRLKYRPLTMTSFFETAVYNCFKKGYRSQNSILEPKGTLGTVIMSDNAPAKVVTLSVYGRSIMMNLHFILCKVSSNSNKLFVAARFVDSESQIFVFVLFSRIITTAILLKQLVTSGFVNIVIVTSTSPR